MQRENFIVCNSIQLVKFMLPSPSFNSKAATYSAVKLTFDDWLVAQTPHSSGAPFEADAASRHCHEDVEEVVTIHSGEDEGSFRGFNVTLHYLRDQHSSEVPDFRLESSHLKSLLFKSRFSATSLQEDTERSRPIDTNVDCIALLKANKTFMQYMAEKLCKETRDGQSRLPNDTSHRSIYRPISPGDPLKLSIPFTRTSISRK